MTAAKANTCAMGAVWCKHARFGIELTTERAQPDLRAVIYQRWYAAGCVL